MSGLYTWMASQNCRSLVLQKVQTGGLDCRTHGLHFWMARALDCSLVVQAWTEYLDCRL